MKLVLAHDYLVQMGGAERVVAAVHRRFAAAPIYTSAVAWDRLLADFRDAELRVSWMQRLPGIQHPTHFKKYFFLYPGAFRSFPPPDATTAWISASAFAKFMRFQPETRTVCYLHNATRFLWQTESYLAGEAGTPLAARILRPWLSQLRQADREATLRMKVLLANSENVRRRIQACYGRDAEVLHPPVETERFRLAEGPGEGFLVLSRLLGYKNIGLAVQAFSRLGKLLHVVGEGPDRRRLEGLAGPSVRFHGSLPDDQVAAMLRGCRALVVPGEEDFGITPLEAMASGRPVLALAAGGALETVVDGVTGVLFQEPDIEALIEGVKRIEAGRWDAAALRAHAEKFSVAAFLEKLERFL